MILAITLLAGAALIATLAAIVADRRSAHWRTYALTCEVERDNAYRLADVCMGIADEEPSR